MTAREFGGWIRGFLDGLGDAELSERQVAKIAARAMEVDARKVAEATVEAIEPEATEYEVAAAIAEPIYVDKPKLSREEAAALAAAGPKRPGTRAKKTTLPAAVAPTRPKSPRLPPVNATPVADRPPSDYDRGAPTVVRLG